MTLLPEKSTKARFLANLEACGGITKAAKAAGVSRETIRQWRKADPDFDKVVLETRYRWEDVQGERAEEETIRRALEGDEEPLVQRGVPVYEMELDPVAFEESGGKVRKLRYKLDDKGELIPVMVTRKPEKLLEKVLRRFAGWEDEDQRDDGVKQVTLMGRDKQVLDFAELLAQAFGARPADARVVDVEAGGPDHDADHEQGPGGGGLLPERGVGDGVPEPVHPPDRPEGGGAPG